MHVFTCTHLLGPHVMATKHKDSITGFHVITAASIETAVSCVVKLHQQDLIMKGASTYETSENIHQSTQLNNPYSPPK